MGLKDLFENSNISCFRSSRHTTGRASRVFVMKVVIVLRLTHIKSLLFAVFVGGEALHTFFQGGLHG